MINFIPLAIAAVIMFVSLGVARSHSPSPFILLGLFALIALSPLWGCYSARKAVSAAKIIANPSLVPAQLPLDPAHQKLQSLPRPRQVRFRFPGGSTAVIVAFGAFGLISALVFARLSNRPFPNRGLNIASLLPLLSLLLVFAVVIVVPYFREKRNLPLLRDGELAFARVVAQHMVQQGKASCSRVDYEFHTNTGQLVRNSSKELTRSVFEDMTIPVFYDPLDPSKNIALCATYLKISENLS